MASPTFSAKLTETDLATLDGLVDALNQDLPAGASPHNRTSAVRVAVYELAARKGFAAFGKTSEKKRKQA